MWLHPQDQGPVSSVLSWNPVLILDFSLCSGVSKPRAQENPLCGFLIPFHEPRATLLKGKIENREQHVIIALKPVGFKLRASYLTSYVTLDTFSLL